MYRKKTFKVQFLTPAFLGNAEQDGQWRTPPFKALLRQWWRVAWAEANGYPSDFARLRDAEGRLFGSAADGTGNRSRVRLRLDRWAAGSLANMPSTPKIGTGRYSIASGLYLGYGPVKTETRLKMQHPIKPGEVSRLHIAYPEDADGGKGIEQALLLMNEYGTLGGRSRNGWGSLALEPVDGTPWPTTGLRAYQRDWRQALQVEWPHAIGRDDQGALIWRTDDQDRWEDVIGALGQIRKGLNGAFKGTQRIILNQPVKGRGARVPSSLRFKVRRSDAGRLCGVIVHVPCTPDVIRQAPAVTEEIWSRVHERIDQDQSVNRLAQ